jgi:hypothetical protein
MSAEKDWYMGSLLGEAECEEDNIFSQESSCIMFPLQI